MKSLAVLILIPLIIQSLIAQVLYSHFLAFLTPYTLHPNFNQLQIAIYLLHKQIFLIDSANLYFPISGILLTTMLPLLFTYPLKTPPSKLPISLLLSLIWKLSLYKVVFFAFLLTFLLTVFHLLDAFFKTLLILTKAIELARYHIMLILKIFQNLRS